MSKPNESQVERGRILELQNDLLNLRKDMTNKEHAWGRERSSIITQRELLQTELIEWKQRHATLTKINSNMAVAINIKPTAAQEQLENENKLLKAKIRELEDNNKQLQESFIQIKNKITAEATNEASKRQQLNSSMTRPQQNKKPLLKVKNSSFIKDCLDKSKVVESRTTEQPHQDLENQVLLTARPKGMNKSQINVNDQSQDNGYLIQHDRTRQKSLLIGRTSQLSTSKVRVTNSKVGHNKTQDSLHPQMNSSRLANDFSSIDQVGSSFGSEFQQYNSNQPINQRNADPDRNFNSKDNCVKNKRSQMYFGRTADSQLKFNRFGSSPDFDNSLCLQSSRESTDSMLVEVPSSSILCEICHKVYEHSDFLRHMVKCKQFYELMEKKSLIQSRLSSIRAENSTPIVSARQRTGQNRMAVTPVKKTPESQQRQSMKGEIQKILREISLNGK